MLFRVPPPDHGHGHGHGHDRVHSPGPSELTPTRTIDRRINPGQSHFIPIRTPRFVVLGTGSRNTREVKRLSEGWQSADPRYGITASILSNTLWRSSGVPLPWPLWRLEEVHPRDFKRVGEAHRVLRGAFSVFAQLSDPPPGETLRHKDERGPPSTHRSSPPSPLPE